MRENEISKVLGELKGSTRTKAARLRDLYDQIEELRKQGFSRETIIDALKQHGLPISMRTFDGTMWRIKKERQREAEKHDKHNNQIDATRTLGTGFVETNRSAPVQVGGGRSNPLHALSGAQAKGDFNHIPKAKFEVDEN